MYPKAFNAMLAVSKIILAIDTTTDRLGRFLCWASVLMAVLIGAVVLLRYGLNIGSIFTQEAATYLHSSLFMLGSIFTLKSGKHVRVDVFYRRFNARDRAWIDAIGGIVLLIPFSIFVLLITWDYVAQSWQTLEVSADPGGIPAVYLLKSLMPVMAVGLFFQGLAEIFRSILVLLKENEQS